jgi:hypothetical protein
MPVARRLTTRTLAVLSAVGAAVAGGTFIVAVLATQGVWYAGYVSEAGVAGQPYRLAYRLGLFGLGAALVLLAGALRSSAATFRSLVGLTAAVLLIGGMLAGVSGSVSCSPGCPLPPYETPTTGDLVHAATSVLGVALCALAVLLLAFDRVDTASRRLARIAAGPVIAAGVLNVYGLAFVGRGYLTGIAERIMLLLVIAWCVAAAGSLVRVPPPDGSAPPHLVKRARR